MKARQKTRQGWGEGGLAIADESARFNILALRDHALTASSKNGEPWWNAHIYQLKGNLLLAASSDYAAETETSFYQALSLAHRQQAKSLELRAATRLARLWQQQGKCCESRDLLMSVYEWFTEGFDTVDLQEAKALLERLSE